MVAIAGLDLVLSKDEAALRVGRGKLGVGIGVCGRPSSKLDRDMVGGARNDQRSGVEYEWRGRSGRYYCGSAVGSVWAWVDDGTLRKTK